MALTASKNLIERYDPTRQNEEILATDSTQYFKGGLVGIASATGRLVKITNGVTVNSVWICDEEVLTGVSTTRKIKVHSGIAKLLNGDTIVAADIGKVARAGANGDDSAYKGGTDATEAVLGTIEGVDAASAPGGAGVFVKVTGFNNVVITATGATNLSGA